MEKPNCYKCVHRRDSIDKEKTHISCNNSGRMPLGARPERKAAGLFGRSFSTLCILKVVKGFSDIPADNLPDGNAMKDALHAKMRVFAACE